MPHLFRFIVYLALAAGILYLAHWFTATSLLGKTELSFLGFSYKFNFGITLIFTSTILLFAQKLKDQIGFIFLAESTIKLGLFFFLSQKLGFEIGKNNFFEFFVPYIGCLSVELFFIIR